MAQNKKLSKIHITFAQKSNLCFVLRKQCPASKKPFHSRNRYTGVVFGRLKNPFSSSWERRPEGVTLSAFLVKAGKYFNKSIISLESTKVVVFGCDINLLTDVCWPPRVLMQFTPFDDFEKPILWLKMGKSLVPDSATQKRVSHLILPYLLIVHQGLSNKKV